MSLRVSSLENYGTYSDEPIEVRRFHDAYESKTAQVEIGVTDKAYADRLFLGVIASQNYKQLQVGHNMNIVIGEAFDEDKVLMPTLKYKKSDLIIEDLSLSIFANYNIREALSADTSSYTYDWYQYSVKNEVMATSGEISWYKKLFRFNDKSALVTSNLSYRLDQNQSISINNTYSHFNRVGEDPISPVVVPFSEPNTISKNVFGLAYSTEALNNRLKTVVFAKHFLMNSVGYDGDKYNKSDTALTKITTSYNRLGYGVASTFFVSNGTQFKASYEKTYRLPQADEMFGNGLLLLSNLAIKPEESDNFNFGVLSNNNFGEHGVVAEFGYLYRLPKNMIRYAADGIEGFYENNLSVKGYSLEGGIKYSYKRRLNAEVNTTYQRMTHNNKLTPEGNPNYLYGGQLANMPILFGNFMVGYQVDNFLKKGNQLSLNWSTLFVDNFFLKTPSNGAPSKKKDIQQQVSHSANVAYSLKNGRYTISVASTNLTDNSLYDNWNLPKPGRAFNVKFRYYFIKP